MVVRLAFGGAMAVSTLLVTEGLAELRLTAAANDEVLIDQHLGVASRGLVG